VKKVENPKFKEEEEAVRLEFFSLKSPLSFWILIGKTSSLQLRKRFTEQVKMEEARFRQWGAFRNFLHTTFRFAWTLMFVFWSETQNNISLQNVIDSIKISNKLIRTLSPFSSFVCLSQEFD